MNVFLSIASLSGFLAVAFGALGAHKVEKMVTPHMLEVYQKGAQYHMYHSLALLAVALLLKWFPAVTGLKVAGWFFVAGILLFSFSLYTYSLTGIKVFAHITPFGGVCFLVGWVLLFIQAFRLPSL